MFINSYFPALLTILLTSSDYLLIYRPISTIWWLDIQLLVWHLKTFIHIFDNTNSLGLTGDGLSLDGIYGKVTQLIMAKWAFID